MQWGENFEIKLGQVNFKSLILNHLNLQNKTKGGG
jgi:hypothetical protein